MKKLTLLVGFTLMMITTFGQSQGISYQAVIISANAQQIPGSDIDGNILPNHAIMIRFSILDAAGTIDYQEEQAATTDAYGMINLIIGQGTVTAISPHAFNEIDWSGENKDIKVDISVDAADVFYTDFSYQQLNFVPYAYHKNITATGTMIIDGSTTLKNRLDVTNQSPVYFTGDLSVKETTTIDGTLIVNDKSKLNGQVTINANVNGAKDSDASYPLVVQGSNQGIVVKVDGSRSGDNNFITFRDEENIQGRIEGQTSTEVLTSPEWIYDNVIFAIELVISGIEEAGAITSVVAASTSSTGCVGLGACVTAPIPSLIGDAIKDLVLKSVDLALKISEPVAYNVFKFTNIGISYESGSGDYAEWLPKSTINETFSPGDIIGVKAGHISKSTENADHYLVISYKPVVLGNMPEQGQEANYEKVAFMGQVPVKVFGKVHTGDYILPDGGNNGVGIAVSPQDIQPEQYQKIVGVAWSANETSSFSLINVAVGLHANDMVTLSIKQEQKIKEQKTELDSLKNQLDKMNSALAQLLPDYASIMKIDQKTSTDCVDKDSGNVNMVSNSQKSSADLGEPLSENTIYYYEISENQMEAGIAEAEKILRAKGVDIDANPFFKKLKTDPTYRTNYINGVVTAVNTQLKENMSKDAKSGSRVVMFSK